MNAGTVLAPDALLREMLAAPDHLWSMGTFGALMGFTPIGAAVADGGTLIAGGAGGWLRLDAIPRLLAFETISSDPLGWNHGVALCLAKPPAHGKGADRVVLAAGADDKAIRPEDRGLALFDLGLEQAGCRALFRPDRAATEAVATLCGRSCDEVITQLATLPGTWIVETPLGRLERRHEGDGPAPLMRVGGTAGRKHTHATSTPVPEGWLPYAHAFPPHPARNAPGAPAAFDPKRHAAFQALLARYGDPRLHALKVRVNELLERSRFETIRTDRHGSSVIRVALRQSLHVLPDGIPDAWLDAHDRALKTRLMETSTKETSIKETGR